MAALLLLLTNARWTPAAAPGEVPLAPPQTTARTYHGTSVPDPFRWLETESNAEARSWVQAQTARSRQILDASPLRSLIEAEIRKWVDVPIREFRDVQWVNGKVYCLVSENRRSAGRLISFPGPMLGSNELGKVDVVLDPAQADPSHQSEIDWFVPSPDGSSIAVLLKNIRNDLFTLQVWRTTEGVRPAEILTSVQTSKRRGSVAWAADGKGFLYTRYPTDAAPTGVEGAGRIYWHDVGGDPAQDRLEWDKGFPADAALELKGDTRGLYFAASSRNQVTGEAAHWLRLGAGKWRLLAPIQEKIEQIEFGRDPSYVELPADDGLYLLSRARTPKGRIVRLPLSKPVLSAENLQVIIPEAKEVLIDFRPAGSGIYASYLKGGTGLLVFHDLMERDVAKRGLILPLPPNGSLSAFRVTHGDRLLFQTESFIDAPEWSQYDPTTDRDRTIPTPLYDLPGLDFADCEVHRLGVRSEEGTRVPLYLVHRRGARPTGLTPTILLAPDGGGRAALADFNVMRKTWLNQGGMFALAQIRGGTELGPEWRQSGIRQEKQQTYADLAACARFLVESNYTKPGLLALWGRDFGALSVAGLVTEQAGLLQAAVLDDGAYDLLEGGSWWGGSDLRAEVGSPARRDAFPALLAASPYHRIRNQQALPALWIGTHPGAAGLSPVHSSKFVARLQASSASPRPILYQTSASLPQTPEERFHQLIADWADRYTFLFDQLSAPYSLVDRGPWSGGLTPTSAVVKAKLLHSGLNARLAISKNPLFTPATFLGQTRSDASLHNLVAFDLPGLDPGTDFYYAIEVNGRFDWASRGQFRTFPAGPASFRIAFASCAKTASVNEVFDRIRESRPLFYLNMGDFHYLNITSNNVNYFREAYDIVLSSPQQARLYRNVPLVYMWDDHDYGGNNSNRKASSHHAARQAYEEYVPHYPLTGKEPDSPIYQAFTVGRVRFIITDLRSQRDDVKKADNASKSMMGDSQKAWFKQQLLDAKGKYPLICWMSSVPWLGVKGTNYYPFIKGDDHGFFPYSLLLKSGSYTNKVKPAVEEDHWCVFSTERREIADFVKTNQIHGLCILNGDSHMLAADDGSHGDFATQGGAPIPVMCAAPLDQTPSIKGGPYSQGIYRVKRDEGCYGLLDINDRGDSIEVSFSGRNNKDEEKVSLRFSVPATLPSVPKSPSP